MRKYRLSIFLFVFLGIALWLSSCKVGYKAIKINDAIGPAGLSIQTDTFISTASMEAWFKNWSKDRRDGSIFDVIFYLRSAQKGEQLKISAVNIELKNYPADSNKYAFEKCVLRKRFHPPYSNYRLDTVVTDLEKGKNIDLADGNIFVFNSFFKKPGPRHFSPRMQLDVTLNTEYYGKPAVVKKVFVFKKYLRPVNM